MTVMNIHVFIKTTFGENASLLMNLSARILIGSIKQLETNLKCKKQICKICKLAG